ncbi:hypothetical protein TSUD_153420 [Trifolium subterraneum]|uniref:EF-hand domain-containing protein n=1 Tax=Trifolium subterraneum TaxID=3900 RepID=A0A2Z6NN40_TRISU|nr:hypothetical protein TSUD_153420 [Trifolium subterraneum]
MRPLGHIPTNLHVINEVDVPPNFVRILSWMTELILIKFDEDHNNFISVDEFRHFATWLDKHEMNVETANDAVDAYDNDRPEVAASFGVSVDTMRHVVDTQHDAVILSSTWAAPGGGGKKEEDVLHVETKGIENL